MKTNVLVVGSGGREHAIVWKISNSPLAGRIYCAPGNGGISEIAECVPIKTDDIKGLVSFAQERSIDLVIVGPEVPLTMGLVDELTKAGIKAFGPNALAAEIEGSKVFSKGLLLKYGIPTAKYGVFEDSAPARAFVRGMEGPWVIKADGLAAGKGVLIAQTVAEADSAIEEILSGKILGPAGEKIVIEEFLEGEELSVLAFCDKKNIVAMVPAQDHKRIYDDDKGPNTGGMGAYSPVAAATPELMREIDRQILRPVMEAMQEEGRPYSGVLYPGLMLTKDGPKVLEFNCRFGDPETQVILPLLKTDLLEIILAVVDERLSEIEIEWQSDTCVTVIMASGGYPGDYQTGIPIYGINDASKNALIFHSGTKKKDGCFSTAGGRVLSVTAQGDNIAQALKKAYNAVEKISFEKAHYRRDIAKRALKQK